MAWEVLVIERFEDQDFAAVRQPPLRTPRQAAEGRELGSFMSNQTQWAVYGGVAFLVGAALLLYVNRRRAR